MERRTPRSRDETIMSRFRSRHKIKHLTFPLGIINLMLFGLVLVVVLNGWYMFEGLPEDGVAHASELDEVEEIDTQAQTVAADCGRHEFLKSKVLRSAKNCNNGIEGESEDLDDFDQLMEACEGEAGPDPIEHQEQAHRTMTWRARCDRTDAGYDLAINLAGELRDNEESESTETELIQEFYERHSEGQVGEHVPGGLPVRGAPPEARRSPHPGALAQWQLCYS